jgi:hypothetical protein
MEALLQQGSDASVNLEHSQKMMVQLTGQLDQA